jgi:site-specific recombinase XerD
VLQKLPPYQNTSKEYRDKSINELLQMGIDKTLAVKTINKTLTRVGSLFKYALQEGFYEGQNPATEMNLPMSKFEEDNRAPFTKDELEKLMRSTEYVNDKHRKSYQFWMPIIALFTGMRQIEIAQFHLEDIRQE